MSRIDSILSDIGKYYGIISHSNFVGLLVSSAERPALSVPNPVNNNNVTNSIADALISVTGRGRTTSQLIRHINDQLAGAQQADKNAIRDKIRICYNNNEDNTDQVGVILTSSPNSRPLITLASNQTGVQGTGDASSSYSLRSLCSIPESSPINRGTGAAVSDRSFSIIQVFGNRLSPANRDLGALTFFMNAVPTIEMSRAVPFIDIVLIQQGAHLTGDNNRISSLSMGQFLMGNASVSSNNSTEMSYLSANDSEIVSSNASIPEFEPTASSAGGASTPVPISTAGMELFTAPQTLVPANEIHQEQELSDSSAESTVRRSASVLDRFRPLMTIKSLTFSVVPSGGMMSYKSGRLAVTLHDKSRLAEVAAFVRPARYGTTHLQIEYGWAHPAAQPQRWGSNDEGSEINNLIGQFIGNLRVKEKYQIVNSSFSFDDSGQVEIDMTISMLSARAGNQVHIGLGFETTTAFQNLAHFTQMIQQIRSRLPEATAAAITGESDVLGSLSDPNTALSMSSDTINQINRLTRITNSPGASSELRDLGSALRNMMGTVRRPGGENAAVGADGLISMARESIRNIIDLKISSLSTTPDPFFLKTTASGILGSKKIDETTVRDYVSLGKIISTFAGATIAQSGIYKDVQIIFYNFNEKASYMYNRNIASFPINKQDFSALLDDELSQLVNMSIDGFMNFLSTYFLHDPGAPAYGFSAMYGERTEEDRSSRQLEERYRSVPGREGQNVNLSEDSAALFDAQQRILRHAYGTEGEAEFKSPTIQALMETIPVGANEESGTPATGNDTILKIHIFDSQCTSHATLQSFLDASSSNRIGTLNSAAQALNASTGTPAGTSSSTASGGARGSSDPPVGTTAGSNLDAFYEQLRQAQDAGLIEPWPPTEPGSPTPSDILRPNGSSRYRMRGGFSNLKSFIMRTMPSMRYGEGASGIMSAKVTSQSDSALSTVNMLRQARSPDTPAGARASGLPLQVAPVECNLETIGCPLWNFGQQIFIDFGTGTTIDCIYGVTGVEHNIGPGEFKTTVKLTPLNSYAKYQSMFDQIESAFTTIEGMSAGATDGGTRGST